MKKKAIIFLVVVFTIVGGAYFFIYQQANAKLKLAELKSDLDGMYEPLQKLALLQIPSAKERLKKVSKAISIHEQMLRSVADHDHEQAVKSAYELVKLMPKNKDGIRVLRESGQIFYLLREALTKVSWSLNSEKPTNIDYKKVDFNVADDNSAENNVELVKYIQKGLADMGIYWGDIDGKYGEQTKLSLELFVTLLPSVEKVPIEVNSRMANAIAKKIALEKAVKEWKEKKFYEINKAYQLANRAVELDPHYSRAVNLKKDIDQAHESMVMLMALDVMKDGASMVSLAKSTYNLTLLRLNLAASSSSVDVSDAYSKMKPLLMLTKRLIDVDQKRIDNNMILIATYKGERAKEFFSNLKEYVEVTRSGVDSLLFPQSNLFQFRKVGGETTSQVKRVTSRLTASMPNSAEIKETAQSLVKIFGQYVIFDDPKTEKAIDSHSYLYSI